MAKTKHIQAYFKEWNDAEGAATDLQALGAAHIMTDRTNVFEHFIDDPTSLLPMVPQLSGQFISVPSPLQPSGVLLGGLDAAEGEAPEDADAAGVGTPVLSAIIETNLYDKAMDIVKKYGGTTDSRGVE
ncbi:hypothetical protein [Paenibacillus alkalitolerans]|uniref:hypothetical protein n=1 Tax=Paenibacillus alkalitolerans TaxID=2799335 RepID=UPI0018F6D124|nr:hypothetical protein [Paenibacillus alkalitolerans]